MRSSFKSRFKGHWLAMTVYFPDEVWLGGKLETYFCALTVCSEELSLNYFALLLDPNLYVGRAGRWDPGADPILTRTTLLFEVRSGVWTSFTWAREAPPFLLVVDSRRGLSRYSSRWSLNLSSCRFSVWILFAIVVNLSELLFSEDSAGLSVLWNGTTSVCTESLTF